MLLWDVDTQADFMLPNGRLYVQGAEQILPNLAKLTAWAAENQVMLVSSADAHREGDPELAIYGPHCMVGTPGQRKLPPTLLPDRITVPNQSVTLPELSGFQQIILEKQAFDPFTNPNADAVLQRFGRSQPVVLYGVATDICVAATAQSLLARGRHILLVEDAVCALDAQKADDFVRDLVARGGELTQTDALLRREHGFGQ